MQRRHIRKFIIILIIMAVFTGIGYTILYDSLSLDPKVSKSDILYAKGILNEIESLTVYNIKAFNAEEKDGEYISSLVDIEEVKSKIYCFEVDNYTVKALFPKAKYKPNFVLWKGDKLGVAKLNNGDEIKIRISFYGGFFAIVGIEGYYAFDDDIREEWEEAVNFAKFHEEGEK